MGWFFMNTVNLFNELLKVSPDSSIKFYSLSLWFIVLDNVKYFAMKTLCNLFHVLIELYGSSETISQDGDQY